MRYDIPRTSPTGSCTPRNQIMKPETTSAQVYSINTRIKKGSTKYAKRAEEFYKVHN